MTSLPEPILDTYKRYKRGTNTVIDWICRYGGQSASNSRNSRSRSKKKAAGGSGSNVEIRDLPNFARVIVDNKVKMPSALLYVLKDVIGARSMCARWYRGQSQQLEPTEECHKHEHFIRVLEELYAILKPAEDIKNTEAKAKNKTAEPSKTKHGEDENPFKHLEQEQLLDAKATVDVANYFDPEPDFKHTKKIRIVHSEEESQVEEQLFAFFCYFKDAIRIRKFVDRIWTDYASGKFGLTSVASTTNVAFDLLRHANEDLIKIFPDMSHHGKVCQFFEVHGYPIYTQDTKKRNDKLPERTTSPAQDDELTLAAMICSGIWKDVLEARSSGGLSSPPLRLNGDTKTSDLLWKDTEVADILALDYMDSACFFKRGVGYQVVQAFGNLVKADAKNFPSWLVIAFDIVRRLEWTLWQNGVDQPYRELLGYIDKMTCQFGHIMDFAASWHYSGFTHLDCESGSYTQTLIHSLTHALNDWVDEDPILEARLSRMKGAHKEEYGERHFLLKHDPVLCGIMLSEFKLLVHQYSLELAQRNSLVIVTANMYNATLASGVMTEKWQDMEDLIAIHALDNNIFVGGRPTASRDCLSRFFTVLGYSIVNRAKGRSFLESIEQRPKGRNTPHGFFTMPRKIKSTSVYANAIGWSAPLKSSLLKSKRRGGPQKIYTWPGHQLPENMTCILPKVVDGQIKRYLELQKKSLLMKEYEHAALDKNIIAQWQKNKELDQLQLLDVFYRSVEVDDFHFSFDYFSIVEKCMAILTEYRQDVVLRAARSESPLIAESHVTLRDHTPIEIVAMLSIDSWAEAGNHDLLRIAKDALMSVVRHNNHPGHTQNHALAYRTPRSLQYVELRDMNNGIDGQKFTQLDRMLAYTLLKVSEKAFYQLMGFCPQTIPSDAIRGALKYLRKQIQRRGDVAIKKLRDKDQLEVGKDMDLRDQTLLLGVYVSHSLPRRLGEKDARMMMLILGTHRDVFSAAQIPFFMGPLLQSVVRDKVIDQDGTNMDKTAEMLEERFHLSEAEHIIWPDDDDYDE
ncbi:hypothetical protein TWF696_006112 [Orbilia brochopaga]|uniref:DUF6604 domain-containing protein n=1 Tax=Orbilia brochopaga TaxID=3140254 RepID=A0AAV9UYJ7_9PEZI